MTKPLAGITVIDFSQFLSGPVATLRLADLGATVIKVERPDAGDLCRQLYVSNFRMQGESSLFRAINRNKQSVTADLKDRVDADLVRELINKADIVVHNFRPGVMDRLGFDYFSVKQLKPDIIYGEITGYGNEGPWKDKPGQDLLLQALSGLTWLSGNAGDGPVPMGLAIVDNLAGCQLVQGLLAVLLRRELTGDGGLVQVSMLESILDFQFENLTVYFQDGGQPVLRTQTNHAHPLVAAPYGIYETSDGYLALAMASIPQLGQLLDCPPLLEYQQPARCFDERDTIKKILADHLKQRPTSDWLAALEPADIWCAEVLDWSRLIQHEGFRVLSMLQDVVSADDCRYKTTRCPIRIDGELLVSETGSPTLGEHNDFVFGKM